MKKYQKRVRVYKEKNRRLLKRVCRLQQQLLHEVNYINVDRNTEQSQMVFFFKLFNLTTLI